MAFNSTDKLIIDVPDTTTHAMTEVALGLSMAFFALLILALLSFATPNSTKSDDILKKQGVINKVEVSTSSSSDSEETPLTPQFVFYFKGKLVDEKLQPVEFAQLDDKKEMVLAVPRDIEFSKVISLRKKINHSKLSITSINKQWQSRLEQLL